MNSKKSNVKRRSNSQFAIAVRQFKRNKLAMGGLIVLILIALACACESYLTPYEYDAQNIAERFAPLSWAHPLGTDQYGRDLLTRLLRGGQISLLIGLTSVLLGAATGAVLGVIAGYYGGITETIIMRFMDVLLSVPSMLLAAALATALGTGVYKSIIAIAISVIASHCRIVRAAALSVRDQEYMEAARACGASKKRQLFKYVLPNCLPMLIVQMSMRFGSCITAIAGLSFYGLGVQPPTAEWGYILNSGRDYIRQYWPIVVFPGLFIAITLICINLIGDGLRDALDPRLMK